MFNVKEKQFYFTSEIQKNVPVMDIIKLETLLQYPINRHARVTHNK